MFDKRFVDSRMAVSLIDRRISAQKVIVFFPLEIPHKNALTLVQSYGKGMIVMCAIPGFAIEHFLRGDSPAVLDTLK